MQKNFLIVLDLYFNGEMVNRQSHNTWDSL
jgi:hypothetical protein